MCRDHSGVWPDMWRSSPNGPRERREAVSGGLPRCSFILYTFVVMKTGFTGIRSPQFITVTFLDKEKLGIDIPCSSLARGNPGPITKAKSLYSTHCQTFHTSIKKRWRFEPDLTAHTRCENTQLPWHLNYFSNIIIQYGPKFLQTHPPKVVTHYNIKTDYEASIAHTTLHNDESANGLLCTLYIILPAPLGLLPSPLFLFFFPPLLTRNLFHFIFVTFAECKISPLTQ